MTPPARWRPLYLHTIERPGHTLVRVAADGSEARFPCDGQRHPVAHLPPAVEWRIEICTDEIKP